MEEARDRYGLSESEVYESRPTWPEEPSRESDEVVQILIGELNQYPFFSSRWDFYRDEFRSQVIADIRRAYDRYINEER